MARVELPVPEGPYDVDAAAIHGNWATGHIFTEPEGPQNPPAGASVSVLWDLRTRSFEVVAELGEVPTQIQRVNAAGDLLFMTPPAVICDGEAYALPDPVQEGAVAPPGSVYDRLVAVVSISDDGSTIAGKVYLQRHAGTDHRARPPADVALLGVTTTPAGHQLHGTVGNQP